MQGTRRRRACVECFQRKVRCEWQEDISTCLRCQRNGLQCSLPDSTQAVLRNPVRDVISTLDQRLRKVEASSSSQEHIEARGAYQPEVTPGRPGLSGSPMTSANVSETTKASHEPSLPWRMLNTDDTILDQAETLAEEELTLHVRHRVLGCDLLQDFPLLSPIDVIDMARVAVFEMPFSLVHWPSMKAELRCLLEHRSASSAGHLSSIFMCLAFGASRLPHISRLYDQSAFFTRALDLLPQVMLQQDAAALKALTLIMHYLQGSDNPTQCYTFLGTASNLAIALGLHKSQASRSVTGPVEYQESLRAWWLCFLVQRTVGIIHDLPMVDNSVARQTPLPTTFHMDQYPEVSQEEIRTTIRNDEEAVALFKDVIEIIRERDLVLASNEEPSDRVNFRFINANDLLLPAPGGLQAHPSKVSVRSRVREFARLNSVIVVEHRLRASRPSAVAIKAAVQTIQMIESSQTEGLTMCMWMWLYYAFTAVALLFRSIVQRPLDVDAAFHLALISDINGICGQLAPSSAGARRIELITRDMDYVGFKLMKTLSKKRAMESTTNEDAAKRSRTEPGVRESTLQESDAGVDDMFQAAVNETVVPEDFNLPEGWLEPPPGFDWEDWETWFQDTTNNLND